MRDKSKSAPSYLSKSELRHQSNLYRDIIEKLFDSFPPPLVREMNQKKARESEKANTVVTIDDTEDEVDPVMHKIPRKKPLRQTSLKSDTEEVTKKQEPLDPFENEWIKKIEDLKYETIDSNPVNPFP